MKKRIKYIGFVLAMVMCLTLLPLGALAESDEEADEITGETFLDASHFPDSRFWDYIRESFDTDQDDRLSEAEVAAVTEINCNFASDISSMEGIEYFTALKTLSCNGSGITSLDVSSCSELEEIYCTGCKLTELNVDGCAALTILMCTGNKLSELDVSSCTALETFDCGLNAITSLDVGNNSQLKELGCSKNQIDSLDLSGNPRLVKVECDDNLLQELDVSGNPSLDFLSCDNNKLTKLELGASQSIRAIQCAGNALGELDISACPVLISAAQRSPQDTDAGQMWYWDVDTDGSIVCDQSLELITYKNPEPATEPEEPDEPVPGGHPGDPYEESPVIDTWVGDETWTLSSEGVLTIFGDGPMKEYGDGIGLAPWEKYRSIIRSIVVKEGVTEISRNAFIGLPALEEVTLPEGLTQIRAGAFYACGRLRSISLPLSLAYVWDGAFSGCSSLAEVNYPGTPEDGRDIRVGIYNIRLLDITGWSSYPDAGSCGENVTWRYADGTLTISGEGAMYDLSEADIPWDQFGEVITKVVVEEGVANLADGSIAHCPFVETIVLPESLESISYKILRRTYEKTEIWAETQRIYYAGTEERWREIEFTEFIETYKDGSGYIASLENYDFELHFESGDPDREAPASDASGDANGDGAIDRKDRIYLARYLAGWEGYEDIDLAAADVNKDGSVDRKDRIYLARSLAGWDGYEL